MRDAFRKFALAVPFGALVAIATHFVRFGDEHSFAGQAHEQLVAATVGGTLAITLYIVRAFLFSGTTIVTGTIAAARARLLVPSVLVLFAVAAGLYYGIETLEGNGIELGLPTVVLAALAVIVAYAMRRLTALLALVVAELLRDWLTRLGRRTARIRYLTFDVRPLHSQIARSARRFGRAPPNGQRFRVFAV